MIDKVLAIFFAMMYWVNNDAYTMQVFIHIGTHNYPVARTDCRASRVLRDQLLQKTLGRTPKASPSSMVISANLQFKGNQLIGKDKEKLLHISYTEMQKVMYKFKNFTSPTLC